MYDDEEERKESHNQFRNTFRILGLIIFPLGVILTIGGFLSFVGMISSGDTNFGSVPLKMIIFGAGGSMLVVGGWFLVMGYQGKIYRYHAMEAKDAVTIAGDGAGEGLARGVRRGGGIKFDPGRSRSREVVKIRCRKCGYLDSEDAKYCSKCGARI